MKREREVQVYVLRPLRKALLIFCMLLRQKFAKRSLQYKLRSYF